MPKVAFITHRGTYVYRVMPFGLINSEATYQKMVNKVFSKQIRKNMECYVDDMIVKSKEVLDHNGDLKECFKTLQKNNMRLNPSKCTFGVKAKKFLGYIVSQRGIEENSEKDKSSNRHGGPEDGSGSSKVDWENDNFKMFCC